MRIQTDVASTDLQELSHRVRQHHLWTPLFLTCRSLNRSGGLGNEAGFGLNPTAPERTRKSPDNLSHTERIFSRPVKTPTNHSLALIAVEIASLAAFKPGLTFSIFFSCRCQREGIGIIKETGVGGKGCSELLCVVARAYLLMYKNIFKFMVF